MRLGVFRFQRKQYAKVRELEPMLARAANADLDAPASGSVFVIFGWISDEPAPSNASAPRTRRIFSWALVWSNRHQRACLAWAVRAHAHELRPQRIRVCRLRTPQPPNTRRALA